MLAALKMKREQERKLKEEQEQRESGSVDHQVAESEEGSDTKYFTAMAIADGGEKIETDKTDRRRSLKIMSSNLIKAKKGY